jgi:glycosyltransferase involved in cell wall biosynthesis
MTERKLRLCLLNYEYPPIGGGAASATREIARALTRQGYEVTVVTAGIGDLVGERAEDGIRTIRLRCRRQRPDGAAVHEMLSFLLVACRKLPLIARAAECDGIICFFTIPCGLAAWVTSKLTGVPYVISLRGGDVPGLVPSMNSIHSILTPFRRAVLSNALSIVANSRLLQSLSRSADPFPVSVIPNGVNSNTFRPNVVRLNTGVFRVLAVGRLHAEKNHAFALQMIADVSKRLPQPVEYHIVGDGSLKAELAKVVDDLGLIKQVFWHGWTPRERLPEIYRLCDCLLHPSFYEAMPNAVLEAMAAGLPVVASNVPGNSEIIRHGETGYLYNLSDSSGFRDALVELATNVRACRNMGDAARRFVEIEYNWDQVAMRYADIFAGHIARVHAQCAA